MADTPETLTLTLDGGDVVDQAAPRSRARPRRADHRAGQRRLLRRRRVPPRDPRLHGAGRRPHRHRHARLGQAQPQGRILAASRTSAASARWRAPTSPNIGQQPVLHLLRRRDASSTASTPSGARSIDGMEHVDALPKGEPPRDAGQDRQGDALSKLNPLPLAGGARGEGASVRTGVRCVRHAPRSDPSRKREGSCASLLRQRLDQPVVEQLHRLAAAARAGGRRTNSCTGSPPRYRTAAPAAGRAHPRNGFRA